jgi:hypothetical protein
MSDISNTELQHIHALEQRVQTLEQQLKELLELIKK